MSPGAGAIPEWIGATSSGVWLRLHVQPAAKRTEIVGPHGDALKLRLAAPPVDGRANEALIDYLCARLAMPRGAIRLSAGEGSRRKRVELQGATLADMLQKLAGGG